MPQLYTQLSSNVHSLIQPPYRINEKYEVSKKFSPTLLDNLQKKVDKDTLYEKENLSSDDILNIEDLLDTLNLKQILGNNAKTFIRIFREIAQNTLYYSFKVNDTSNKISITNDKEKKILYIDTFNYFEGLESKESDLISTFDEINGFSDQETESAYKYKLLNGENVHEEGFSHAGLGFLKIAKQIRKNFEGKIFEYNIEDVGVNKDKNSKNLYKLDLRINFPIS